MSAADGWDEDDPYEPDDSDEVDEPDFDDDPDDDWPEPDGGDYETARAYEQEAEHRETVHGGGECDCRPSPAERLRSAAREKVYAGLSAWYRLKAAARHPWTLRIGPAEVTVRLRADRKCGACSGRGWFYTLDRSREDDRPPGYNGTALCGCGSAIGKLAESRRAMRRADTEPPF